MVLAYVRYRKKLTTRRPCERCKAIIRVVKDRYIGTATGHTVSFRYDVDTGLCLESEETFDIEADEDEEGKDY